PTTGPLMATIAGTGDSEPAGGDGGPASDAVVPYPFGIAVDGSGGVFIAQNEADNLRYINSSSGIISESFAVGGAHNLFLTQDGSELFIARHQQIVKVVRESGVIEIVAGTGNIGSSGDGGQA